MKHDSTIQILSLPKRTLAYVYNIGPYIGDTALFEKLFNKVLTWLQGQGLMRSDMESITVYHDHPDEVPVDKQRISVGFTVPVGTPGEGSIQIMELPAGKYVVGSFEIDPKDYGKIWGEVYEYIKANKLRLIPSGPMYESYKNDPREHPEGKHVVDIGVAVNGVA